MRKRFAVLCVVLSMCIPMRAETPEEFDARMARELAAKDPSAVSLWREANAARDANRHDEAARLYAQVYERVPSFVPALRRQARAEHDAGRRDAGLQLGRRAVELERSAENMSVLAAMLAEGGMATSEDLAAAKALASEAADLRLNGQYEQTVLGAVGQVTNDLEMVRLAAVRLETIAPSAVQTHVLRMTVAASDGDWSGALAALDRARAAGMPEADYRSIRAELVAAQPFYLRWWKPAVVALGAWFAGFALMLVAGALLSRIAMRAARNMDDLSAKVRRLYAIVLGVSCAFYYASLPIVIVSVLAFSGGLIYATFVLGHVPIKVVILLAVVAGVSVWSMIKSLFVRPSDDDPGARLDLAAEPKIRALLDAVAAKIGTRPVDNVYVTPSTEVAVMERGKGGQRERCLILGVAALEDLQVRPFKAILAHEYGHFSNRDTAGGAYALRVRNSLAATAVGLAQGGVATWYNPAWWFVNGFHRLFLRISEGASRLQEILADRWAVFAYGADAFESGLRHVVERGVRFDAHVGQTLQEVVDRQLPLANLYTYRPAQAAGDIAAQVEESLTRASSAYDSHPAPAERFALVHALPKRETEAEADDELPVTSLFTNFEALQCQMTAQVRENVRANYGVEIAAAAAAAT